MEITLEMVERLKNKADVSYKQAKEALEYSGGNLLDALIYLEEKGSIPRETGAYYSGKRRRSPLPRRSPCPLSCPPRRKSSGRQSPPGPRGAGLSGFSTPCAAGLLTMSWRFGAGTSPSPPCRC